MTTQEKLRALLTTYPQDDFIIETLELSHSLFSQRFLFTTQPNGLTANLETGEQVTFQAINFEAQLYSTKSDLDKNLSFSLSDLDNRLDDELDRIPLNEVDEKIAVIYRNYNASDLTDVGDIFKLEALNVSQTKGAFTIQAGAPQLNWARTGIIYDYGTFLPLRAL